MKRRIITSLLIFVISIVILAQIFVILKFLEGEHYTIVDGIYWVISTITTVGFGDIVFYSTPGKIYTIFVMVYGVAFIFGFFFPYVVLPFTERRLLFKLPEEADMKNHVIVCGINKISKRLFYELKRNDRACLLMSDDEGEVRKALEEGFEAVLSNYSLESFKKCGIEKAIAVVLFEEPNKSIDILLTLKDFDIDKYVVLNAPEYAKYMLFAGAKRVILPKSVAGSQLAKFVTENMRGTVETKEVVKGYGVAEICVSNVSRLKRMSVEEIEKRFDVTVVSVISGGRVSFNPEKNFKVSSGDVIQAFGKAENLQRLFEAARGYL